jgi:hypothetical protein
MPGQARLLVAPDLPGPAGRLRHVTESAPGETHPLRNPWFHRFGIPAAGAIRLTVSDTRS